jgi:transcriptional regulator with XRE-family HTH domain
MEFVNTPQIGPVIQRHRKERGLTLEKLAEVSGISKSMLSQIERGQTNPTFGVLWNLTRALKIEFSDLLEGGSALPDEDKIELVSAAHTP